ncbi:hypothetical protein PS723_00397 [Pseudomonas fluorescens]|uniref:Uncharacterized protein n=1 Tax=Pseudomonas fluorescens TaxID=294 RepID=A0A5E6ZYD9_PSEFL|nr:hypothetical protein PS723_00394 [Pseudomonas fluorescens]VVN70907.1 hypothetical protein PS723_00397 [Pseudomonas fluorescens]
MSWLAHLGWRGAVFALAVAALLTVAAIQVQSSEPEIALVIGEPWETMRQRSSSTIDPAIPGHYWFNIPNV